MERALLCWTHYGYTERKKTKVLSPGAFMFHKRKKANNLELVFGG